MKHATLKALPILFLLLLSYTGCKKKDKVQPRSQPKVTYTLINNSGTPGDVIQVTTDGKFETDTTGFSIGGQYVILYRINDTAATFRIPVLSPGKVNIDLSKIGAEKTLSFTIGNYTPITQPEAVKKEFTDGIDDFLAWADTLEDQSMVPAMKGLQEVFLSEYEKLSDQEKLQVTYVLQKLNDTASLRELSDNTARLFNPAFNGNRSFRDEFEDKALHFIAYGGLAYGLTVTGISLFLIPSPTFVEKVAGVGFCIAGIKLIKPAKKSFRELKDVIFAQIGFSGISEWTLSTARKTSDSLLLQYLKEYDLVFMPNKKLNLQIPSVYNSVSKENLDQSDFFNVIFGMLDKVTGTYNTVKTGIDKVRSWGWFFSNTIPALPVFENPMPDEPKSTTRLTPAGDVSIENISDANIKLTTDANGDVLSLTATGNNVNETREFTFDLVYRYEKLGINNKKTIQAVYYGDGVPPESVAVSTKDNAPAKISGISQSLQLEAKVLPADAKQEVAWSIVNGVEHAEVDANGKVTSLSEGTVTVRAAAKANAEIYDDMEVIIEEGEGYVLEIGDTKVIESVYHFVPKLTLKQGASISLPNYMWQEVKLTLNGEPVKVARSLGGSSSNYTGIPFGDVPTSADAIHLPDYTFTIYDRTNSKEVNFHLDLTLTNEAYPTIGGKTLKFTTKDSYSYEFHEYLFTFENNGIYTVIDGATGEQMPGFSGKYKWSIAYISPYLNCNNSEINRPPAIGNITFEPEDRNSSFFSLFSSGIVIEEGGTYRVEGGRSCPINSEDGNFYIRYYIKIE